jgi:hypothetical protein
MLESQLGPEGKQLLRWLRDHCAGLDTCRPLVMEMCAISDRLGELRAAHESGEPDFKMVNAETKLSARYLAIWRVLGLDQDSTVERRRPGRPAGIPARKVS